MKIRVLVSGASGDVAQGVIKCLQKTSLDIRIYALCITAYSSWLHKVKDSYISPLSSSEEYINFLIKFILKNKINVFIPCVDSEILKISIYKIKIEEATNCKVCVGDIEKIKITNDKYLTYKFLSENKFYAPYTIIPKSGIEIAKILKKFKFPLIAKKRVGGGSSDIEIINSYNHLRNFTGRDDYVIQEYIQGEDLEITSGIYLSNQNNIIGICTLLRELKYGSTYRAKRFIDKNIDNYIGKVSKKLGLNYLNIQGRINNNKLIIFEFNGRFSGTSGVISKVFNGPELFIKEIFLNQKIFPKKNNNVFYVMRYNEEVVVSSKAMEKIRNRSNIKDNLYIDKWE